MSRLPGFTYRQFVKKLKQLGFAFDRQAKGSHEIWFHPVRDRAVTVPKHSGKTFKKGTLRGMIKDSGFPVSQFLKG